MDWNLHMISDQFKLIAQEAFCIGGISDLHDAERYDSNPSDQSVPVLESYATRSPPRTTYAGRTLSESQDMWCREVKKHQPTWCIRMSAEVPKSKFVQKYGAKLMNAMEYRNKIARGPQGDQMMDQFTEDLQRCFKITEGGEQGRLVNKYCKELEAVNATLQPTTTPLTPVRMQP